MEKISYAEETQIILSELQEALGAVQENEVGTMVEAICQARMVFATGVGRVLLMVQAFVKRLNHLGIKANFVGAVDEPAITSQDVLLVASGSGESVVPLAVMKVAKRYKANIVHVGASPDSSMTEYEDLFVRIPCKTKLNKPDEIPSKQLMSSLFEQSLLLLLDAVAMMIAKKQQITNLDELWQYHANLE
ncbi:phosphoheptose isomerase family protein [Propionispora hippei]|uniref:3-hexulose-6-phosphate isomerase n=1 Tax=Propionispora hippei DSM 15287 TaxID=1123003 RepID=A0A1M6DBU0_9FIRM|nr:sugar isomerase [Propionispora hippei]SHI70706.1 3-hexulose-6-phosphate isomerase [Propionispora hippei DSM 15287]